MSDFAPTDRLSRVRLKEDRPRARTPEIQQELDVAIYDLTEDNQFRIAPRDGQEPPAGPYHLGIGMAERMLVMEITTESGEPAASLHLSLSPLMRFPAAKQTAARAKPGTHGRGRSRICDRQRILPQ